MVPHQTAGHGAAGARRAFHRRRAVAGDDARVRGGRPAHQAARSAARPHRAARPDRRDETAMHPDEPSGQVLRGLNADVRQAQRGDDRVRGGAREQPLVQPRAAVDEQVSNNVAVAVESRRVVGRVVRRRRADGHPAGAGVVVRVAGVARDRAAGRRPGGAVAVGVEVQVVQELVAPAVVVVRVVRSGRAQAGAARIEARVQERARGVKARFVAGGRGAVAVQVPAHRVQLPQRRDVDQPVVVGVVVGALGGRIQPAVVQRRVVVRRCRSPTDPRRRHPPLPSSLVSVVVPGRVQTCPSRSRRRSAPAGRWWSGPPSRAAGTPPRGAGCPSSTPLW